MGYVVLALDGNNQAQIFGTKTGQPFKREDYATSMARRLGEQYPHLETLAMPISELPPMPNPLSRRALARADG